MMDLGAAWFDTSGFMPHGHCYLWTPSLLLMHVGSDLVIGAAYLAIPFGLHGLLRRRPDLPFRSLFAAFGVFIALCGLTHLAAVWNVWHAEYWIEGLLKVATAIASAPAAIALWRAVPDILALPSHAQLAASNRELAESNRELEAFTYTAAHELRSPLHGLRSLLDGLLRSAYSRLDVTDRGVLGTALDEVERMSTAVDVRLRLARIAKEPLERRSIDLSALAQRVATRLAAADPTRAVRFSTEAGLRVLGDAAMLETLVENLLDNAWKFTRGADSPAVHVGRAEDRSDAFVVRDNGVGFDMAAAGRLFQPLVRLHDARDYPGTGVGLATVARIVERHGGSVRIDSRPREGTAVVVELPQVSGAVVGESSRGQVLAAL